MIPAGIAAVSWGKDRLDVFGLASGNAVHHNSWDPSGGWQDSWTNLEGSFASPPTAVASTWGGENRLDVFAVDASGVAHHKYWTSASGWQTDWAKLGGSFASPVAAVSWGENRLDVIAVGSDRAMYHNFWTPWSPWQPDWKKIGESFISAPAAVSWGENRLDVFAIESSGAMMHNSWEGSSWQTKWKDLGGSFTSPPAAVASVWGGENRLDVFGIDSNTAMRHNSWTVSQGWQTDWKDLGGSFFSAVTALSWGENRLDVFALNFLGSRAGNTEVWHNSWTPAGWQPTWGNLGGPFRISQAAVSWSENRLDVFAARPWSPAGIHIFHQWWTPSSDWQPSWKDLGGVFKEPAIQGPAAAAPTNFGSNANYRFARDGQQCDPVSLNAGAVLFRPYVGVLISITETLWARNGLSFQLNAHAKKDGTLVWQQYAFVITGTSVFAVINCWTAAELETKGAWPTVCWYSPIGAPLQSANVLPAGTGFYLDLETDSDGRVTTVSWDFEQTYSDGWLGGGAMEESPAGLAGVSQSEMSPIVAFELDVVGPDGGQPTWLEEGAGTIMYQAPVPLIALSALPSCANQEPTGESSNSTYGLLPALPCPIFIQSFGASPIQLSRPKESLHGLVRPRSQ